jgi:FdhD protein
MNAASKAERLALGILDVERWQGGERAHGDDRIAEETPVALEYNGVSHAVMLASPSDLEDFAVGFSLSEGIVAARSEIYDCEHEEGADGIRVSLRIATPRFAALKERRRNLAGRTGCGLCGVDSLAGVRRSLPPVTASVAMSAETLHAAFAGLQTLQLLQRETGTTHAAAWIGADGRIACLREDVGRHNALDKLIGAQVRRGTDFGAGAVLLTSRASSEMVQKAAAVGIGLVAAVSGTTTLAVEFARDLDVTLVGFVRPGGHVVYSHAHRLLHSTAGAET